MYGKRESTIRPAARLTGGAEIARFQPRNWLRRSLIPFLVGCGLGVSIMGARERVIDTDFGDGAIVNIVASSSTKRQARSSDRQATLVSSHKVGAADEAARRQTLQYALAISDSRPKVGRGIRITLTCKEAVSAGESEPYLRLMDPQRGEYRTELKQAATPGEWVWHSGLEVAGRWTGIAYIPTRRGLQTARIPTIEVQP
jgi:hypothetical protein